MIYDLPTSLSVCGVEYEIRSDFRAVLDVIIALNDDELKDNEKMLVALYVFYPEFEKMPSEHCREALRQCFWFINGGKEDPQEQSKPVRLMDWEQDFQYIVSPVNRVLGFESRAEKYLHWWTFLSAYMEIGECTFAQIVHVRNMKNQGKQLSKQDQEWYAKNRSLVDMKQRYTDSEKELLKKWGGG